MDGKEREQLAALSENVRLLRLELFNDGSHGVPRGAIPHLEDKLDAYIKEKEDTARALRRNFFAALSAAAGAIISAVIAILSHH